MKMAAIVSLSAGQHIDAFVILAVILQNGMIGYLELYNTEESVERINLH
jgi:hypothetical protein